MEMAWSGGHGAVRAGPERGGRWLRVWIDLGRAPVRDAYAAAGRVTLAVAGGWSRYGLATGASRRVWGE